MPGSPITFNAPDDTALFQALGRALGGAWKNMGQTKAQKAIAGGGISPGGALSSTMGSMPGASAGATAFGSTTPSTSPRQQGTDQNTLVQPGQQQQEGYFPDVRLQYPGGSGKSTQPQEPLPTFQPPSAQQIEQRKFELMKQGVTAEDAENAIQRELQQMKEDYSAKRLHFADVAAYRQSKIAEAERFKGISDEFLTKKYGVPDPKTGQMKLGITPDEQNLWHLLAKEGENLGDDTEQIQRADQLFNQLYREPLVQIAANTAPLPKDAWMKAGVGNNQLNANRAIAHDQIKRINARNDLPESAKNEMTSLLRSKLRTIMADKNYGTSQQAYIIGDLSSQFRQSVPKAKALAFQMAGKEKETPLLVDALSKLKPDDSLLLARDYANSKNFSSRQFEEALRIAVSSGKLNLSDYQNQERTLLSDPKRLDINSIFAGKKHLYDDVKE